MKRSGMAVFARVTHALAELLVNLSAIGLVAMTAIVGWQVFGRYVLGSSPSWSEQASLTLMIWFVCLAAAAGVREGFHIRIVAFEEALPPSAQVWLRVFANLVVGVCGAAMAIWGLELVVRTWSHVIPSIGIPRGLAYACLPLAGTLIVVFCIERIAEQLSQAPDLSPTVDEEDPRWS